MKGYALRKVLMTTMTLSALALGSSGVWSASPPPAPVDADFLKLLDSLKSYTTTPDIAKVLKINSSFYTKDEETMAELKKKSEEELKKYLQNSGAQQSSANPVLIKSLNDAYAVSKKKLDMQKAAAAAFADALKEAQKLDTEEKKKEESCTKEFNSALAKGDAVNKTCNDLENDDDRSACADELKACAAKINTDFDKFEEYVKERSKKQPSMAASKATLALAEALTTEMGTSKQVCNNYSASMAQEENAGKCLAKIDSDGLNESQGSPAGIHAELDSNIFIPANRINGWKIFKKMADDKVAETTAEMKKIKDYIEKLGGKVLDLGDGVKIDDAEGDNQIGILTNNGTTVSVAVIKKFFATNPTPEDILREAAALGLTKQQIAHAMNIAGYGGETPSDPNNYAQTKAQEEKYMAKIDEYVASKKGNFNGSQGSIQVPGYSQKDATKNVMSNQGWVTPEMVKKFMETNPTDQQFFAKMAELGLRASDIPTILNGQGLLFKNGDPRQVQLNDSIYGSINNRLNLELYQGTTGYGVSDTYDPYALIVAGTGHIMDEENKTWVPYGFKSSSSQRVSTNNQTQVPTTFSTGGLFGVGSTKAIGKLKLIKPDELKKLRTK